MKFLADAQISVEMVEMIRSLGHDCADAAAIPPRMPDLEVLERAAEQGRVIITSDKDFGELVFVSRVKCPGVILIRVALANEADRVEFVQKAFPIAVDRLPGSFITIALSGVRVRPIQI